MNKEIKYDNNCDANYSCKECDDYNYFPCRCRFLEQENKQLKEKINEAIEYIEYCLEENCEDSCDYLDNRWLGKKLLEILKGE